jgi:hypothetical protein
MAERLRFIFVFVQVLGVKLSLLGGILGLGP